MSIYHFPDHSRTLSEIFLDEFGADDPDEGGSGVVGDGLGQHRFAAAGRPVHQHTPRRVDSDLLVQLEVRQRQLHRLPHLLLLRVQPSDVRVTNVGLEKVL